MKWVDQGIFLTRRKYGETSSIASVFTRENGRYLGLVHGGVGRRLRPVLQTGNFVHCEWNARSVQGLGTFRLEMERAVAAYVLDQPLQLSGVASVCGLIEQLLPERESCTPLFERTMTLLESIIRDGNYMAKYVRWEMDLLREIGFGLSLDACVVTGTVNDLRWVSPKSGSAVSLEAGREYADKLLPLPGFIVNESPASQSEILDGLQLNGHFLGRMAKANDIKLSTARHRFVEQFITWSTGKKLEKCDG